MNAKPTQHDGAQEGAESKIDKRAKYDQKRAERDFLLAIYMPKGWKQPLLGVAIRDLCKALMERQAREGRGRRKLKTLIDELADKIRNGH